MGKSAKSLRIVPKSRDLRAVAADSYLRNHCVPVRVAGTYTVAAMGWETLDVAKTVTLAPPALKEDTAMRTRNFLLAAAAAILGVGQAAVAQYGPMGGPAGPYPDMMAAGGMGMGGPGGFPGPNPYAPPAFAPASYAGMGGPAPMGPMGMGPMPQAPTMAPLGVDANGGMPPVQGGSSFNGMYGG